nr:ABC transporter ATP-binding protein [Chloroflexota bacterium]
MSETTTTRSVQAAAIRCVGLSKRFDNLCAVDQVDLALARGGFLALLGPSGCGKTTLLRLLAGFEPPDGGTIEVDGKVVAGPGVAVPPERRRVGMVFQDYALFPHLDVQANIRFGLPSGPQRAARVGELLELVGLAGLGGRMPHELSGGQQQRVALARALAPQPAVILLDEPFSNLDATLRARVRAEVRQILLAAGATTIFVTHDQEEGLSLADEVAVMWEGRIVQHASPEEIYHHPANRTVASFVGEANFLAAERRAGNVFCELGHVAASAGPDGAVEVMLRPESIRLVPDGRGDGAVLLREFFGHDQLVTVRLPSGTLLRARLGPEERLRAGLAVRVEVQGAAMVYGPALGGPAAPADPGRPADDGESARQPARPLRTTSA